MKVSALVVVLVLVLVLDAAVEGQQFPRGNIFAGNNGGNPNPYMYNPLKYMPPASMAAPQPMAPRILRDDQTFGGKFQRNIDRTWSREYGGYKSDQPGQTFYGKVAEPIIHAAVHTVRGVANANSLELARAADELKTVGKGLHTLEDSYQGRLRKWWNGK
jgi:hypothetical protein